MERKAAFGCSSETSPAPLVLPPHQKPIYQAQKAADRASPTAHTRCRDLGCLKQVLLLSSQAQPFTCATLLLLASLCSQVPQQFCHLSLPVTSRKLPAPSSALLHTPCTADPPSSTRQGTEQEEIQ